MEYFVAIGDIKKHSGYECEIKCELQIGDYVEMYYDDNQDEDDGELVIIKSKLYVTRGNYIIYYAERLN